MIPVVCASQDKSRPLKKEPCLAKSYQVSDYLTEDIRTGNSGLAFFMVVKGNFRLCFKTVFVRTRRKRHHHIHLEETGRQRLFLPGIADCVEC